MVKCPKCNQGSGGDWNQCEKVCPLQSSPYYEEKEEIKYFNEKPGSEKPVDLSDLVDMLWFLN